MIKNCDDLSTYIGKDKERMFGIGIPTVKDWLLHNEKWYIYHFLRHLRYVEFYMNTRQKGDFLTVIPFLWHWFRYKRLGFKMRYNIAPNTTGPGLMIYHTGDLIWVGGACKIGANCTLRPGVVFGRKCEKQEPDPVVVGDNCEFGVGAKIIGSLTIGNNVSIGANAVVTKNIPDNVVVAGIPAKIIKHKEMVNE